MKDPIPFPLVTEEAEERTVPAAPAAAMERHLQGAEDGSEVDALLAIVHAVRLQTETLAALVEATHRQDGSLNTIANHLQLIEWGQ